jgi:serine/threonine protein kinase
MTRASRIEELFAQACELAPGERAAFVATAAGEDIALRVEVMSLLEHAIGAAETLSLAIANEATAFVNDRKSRHVGRRIGPYRIVGLLGEGGMGAVYAAERDAEFKQRVAIKILPFGLDLPEAIARFRDERQILASLEHPNIVRLLDGGRTDDDLPYLVMEQIDGKPITVHASDGALAVDARVRLFRDVCAAVHYAHGKQIVHRDLKPSNIFVDATENVKLLDFGIAKLVDPYATRDARTRTGSAPLTPQYASPEQSGGRPVTFATDIYSLGVVLRELLPADIDRDLETIVLKAMREEPAERYASVEELSDDLGRYLAGLPVRAHRPTLRYRGRKLIARHRLMLAAITVVFATAGVAGWALVRDPRGKAALPDHDRRLAVIASNRGSAADDWLAPAVARIAERRLRELDVRYRVVDDPATANVIAKLDFQRTAGGVHVETQIGPRHLDAIDAPTVAAALDKLVPIAADLVSAGQPDRGPDDQERADMARLNARSFAGYRAYMHVTEDALRTTTIDDEALQRAGEAVVALDPAWAHAYLLQFWTSPSYEAGAKVLEHARTVVDRARDPGGVALLEAAGHVIEENQLDPKPSMQVIASAEPVINRNPDDLLGAYTLVNGYGQTRLRSADQIALQRRLHERYPDLRFGSDLASAYQAAGRPDDAARVLHEWLRAAPQAEQAFIAQLPVQLDPSNADAAVAIARDLVFLHGASQHNLLVLCDTLIVADRPREAAAVADRLLAGPASDRPVARNRAGIIALSEGQFGRALEALASADESELINLGLAYEIAQYIGATADGERLAARMVKVSEGKPVDPIAAAAKRFTDELAHGCPSIAAAMAQAPPDAPIADFARRWLTRTASTKGCATCAEVVRLGFSTTETDAQSLMQFVDCAEKSGELQLAKDALDRIPAYREPMLQVLVHFRLGRVLEHLGKPAEARAEYATFLAHWGHADRALPDVDEARAALARLHD